MVSPVHGDYRRCQAETPLIDLFKFASPALMSSPASAQETVDLHVPGGPSTRMITTSYPQKGRMILQRSSPPWLETPFEVFDKGVFTPNDQHYVSWHWANFPDDIDVDGFRLTVRGLVNQTLSLSSRIFYRACRDSIWPRSTNALALRASTLFH